MRMFDLELYGIVIVPLIIALVQLLKNIGLSAKFGGLVAWVAGIAIASAYGLTEAGWTIFQCIIIGSGLGLSAAGLYSTGKNARETEDI